MAARIEPGRVQAAHQSLHHFVAKADWSDEALLAAVRLRVLPMMQRRGPIRGWMVDDTGIPKKGSHSVGVARQYCGQIGKQDNCQVAVTLSLASDHASLPIAHRLYLPQPWADDALRRAKAGVPDDVAFQTKPQIALEQIRAAVTAGVPSGSGAGRCRLWRRHRVSGRHHRTRIGLCRRRAVSHQLLAAGHGTAAAQALERTRATAVADPTP